MSESSIIAIIVASISAIAAIICRVLDIKLKKLEDKKNEKKKIPINILNILFITGFVIAIGSGVVAIFLELTKPPTEITILNPKDNDIVGKTVIATGTYKNNYNNKLIWVFIYPLKVNRYYPQNNNAEIDANNKWSSIVYIGQDNDIGQEFNIYITLVDKNAQLLIEDYLKTAKNKQDWPGLEELPEGVTKYQPITVKRK